MYDVPLPGRIHCFREIILKDTHPGQVLQLAQGRTLGAFVKKKPIVSQQ